MINLLLRKVIKSNDYKNNDIRAKCGYMTGVIGILLNVFLFILKFSLGTFVNSLAIVSDGFNNLSDSFSNVITLFSYNLSGKKADRNHPFGYGRFEYITSLIIGLIIILVGYELFTSAIDKILNPSEVRYNLIVLISLIISIFIKLWMARLNYVIGKKTNSSIMIATYKDYTMDSVSTVATILSLVFSQFTSLPIDGILSLIVSGMIFYSGFGVIRETVGELLGKKADSELLEEMLETIKNHEKVLGIHDVLMHNYGPTTNIASLHVEVSASNDFSAIHDVIDEIEREIFEKYQVYLTIHMDPVQDDNEFVLALKDKITVDLKSIDTSLSLHDFRIVEGETHTNIIFDVVTPFEFDIKDQYIKDYLDKKINTGEKKYYLVINFDRE
jgi:cation diffusion facilitator family transporter